MEALTPDDVQAVLTAFDATITIQYFDEGATATSQMAADVLDCDVGQIAKSLCFLVDGTPILVIASGDGRIDDKKLAKHFQVGCKKVKMAKAEQCVAIYGYPPGGVPPVAHRDTAIPKYLDESLKRYTQIYAAAGAANTLFGMNIEQLVALTEGTWANFLRDEPAES